MEKEAAHEELYDYRKYDRIWKRVSPELNPYPDVRAEAEEDAAESGESAEQMCCRNGAAPDTAALLEECIDGEAADRCAYLTYIRCAPAYARRRLQMMAADEERHIRRLLTVYYLLTGSCYRPAIPACPPNGLPWCPLLRQMYHQANADARRYEQMAEGMEDSCLREIFTELAADERCHTRQILQMLEKSTLA